MVRILQILSAAAFSALVGCAGSIGEVLPTGSPNTYIIGGYSRSTPGLNYSPQSQVFIDETSAKLVQEATAWCKAHNLVMISSSAPRETYSSDAFLLGHRLSMVFTAIPAGNLKSGHLNALRNRAVIPPQELPFPDRTFAPR